MSRQPKHSNIVKIVDVPSLFRNQSKSSLRTPKNILKIPTSTKSKSKSLKKQFIHHSSSKSMLQNSKRLTPRNLLDPKLTPKSSVKDFKRKQSMKEKKVILLKNKSVKNISTDHSKSIISLKNKSIQSSIKSKASQRQQAAPITYRSSSFKEEHDETLFINSSNQSQKQSSESNTRSIKLCPQVSINLSDQYTQKRANVYQMFKNLDKKFQIIHKDQPQKVENKRIISTSSFHKNGIVEKMNLLAVDAKDDIISIIKNKMVSPLNQSIRQKQNVSSLFQTNKINKVYVSSYRRRND